METNLSCESYYGRGKVRCEYHYSRQASETQQRNPSRSIRDTCCLLTSWRGGRFNQTIFESTLREDAETQYLPVTKRGQLRVHLLNTNSKGQQDSYELWELMGLVGQSHRAVSGFWEAAESCPFCCCKPGLIWLNRD